MSLTFKKFIRLAFFYILFIFIGTFSYLALIQLEIFNKYDYLFLKSGVLLLIASIFTAILLLLLKYKINLIKSFIIYQDILLIFLLIIFINWFVYGLVPFNVSRSNSIIILKYMYDNNGHSKSKDEIKDFVQKKYFDDYDAVGIRLNEQIISGNILKTDQGYIITAKGMDVAESMKFLSNFYNLKNNFLND